MSEPERSGRSRARTATRVRVTSPQMAARPRPPTRPATSEIDEQTGVGEVYMRSLMRAQLRLALTVLAVLALGLGSLPLLFTLDPRLASTRVGPIPLAWLILGVAVYPLLVAAAWWHVRAAERAERDFADLVQGR